MARLLTAGAEGQAILLDGLTANGTVSVVSSPVRTGTAAYACDSTTAACNVQLPVTGVANRTYYWRAWLNFASLPSTAARQIAGIYSGVTVWFQLDITPGGVIRNNGLITQVAPAIGINEWHCLEVSVIADGGTGWTAVVRLDGSTAFTATRTVSSGALPSSGRFGAMSSTEAMTVYLDDLAANDDQGSVQNSWPGTAGRVVMLLPTADSAVGSDWKLGTGTTPSANAYDAVNNTPPLGVSNGAAGSDAKQIRDTVSNTAEPASDVDVALEAYSAKVPAGQVIRVVQAVAAISQSTTTTTLSGELGLTSNPSESRGTFTAAAIGASTFPSSWVLRTGNVLQEPTVTQSAAPVVRLGKRTASTVGLLCCFLGLQVEYESIGATPLTGSSTVTFTAAGGTLNGKAQLSATPTLQFGSSAFLHKLGRLAAVAAIHFTGEVVPPTGRAFLVGNSDITFNAAVLPPLGVGRMQASSAIHFTASVAPPTGKAFLSGTAGVHIAATGGLAEVLPPRLDGDFNDRWASGLHVGQAKPDMNVQIRTGRFGHRYDSWAGDLGIRFSGLDLDSTPWQAFWTPLSDYVDLPNVREVTLEKSTSNNGLTSATIVLDNIFYKPEPGGHHAIKRGFLSPLRGYVAPGRTRLVGEQGENINENEWFEKLFRESQITVHQSYGDAEVKTFTGLVDDVDVTSRPDTLTITARCFGQVLTDQRMFGWSKDPRIKDPVIFSDLEQADDIHQVGDEASASSEADGNPPANVVDGDGDTLWASADQPSADDTEWVQIQLPAGRYDDFYINMDDFGGVEAWVSLYATPVLNVALGVEENPTYLGDPIAPGWVDLDLGDVPGGTDGGHPYIRHIDAMDDGGQVKILTAGQGDFVVGDNSLLRISFRNLKPHLDGNFYVGATALQGRRRSRTETSLSYHYVLVSDVSQIVECVLRWAGFKEWNVELSGVRILKQFVAHRGMTYMDVIQACCEVTGFTFFIADPTASSNSIGVPTFRKTHAVATEGGDPLDPVAVLEDRTLLTGIQLKHSDEPLAYIIRARGREADNGTTVAAGRGGAKRIMFTFRPPWSHQLGEAFRLDRLGGIYKRVIHTDNKYATADDIKFAAYYIGLAEALASVVGSVGFPAWPGVDLDDLLEVRDLSTGVTGRIIVTNRSSTFTRSGEKTLWTMTCEGGVVDTQDVSEMVAIIEAAKRS